ncbi:unnamed protein product [Amaranthus hypochondriacus]
MINNGERGLGVVARDSNGQLLTAVVTRVQASPELSELQAAIHGMDLAFCLGYSYIILEGDSATVINGIRRHLSRYFPLFLLFDYIETLKPFFLGFRCSLVRKNGNMVAHLVARWNSSRIGKSVFVSPFPQSLVSLASLDLI